MNVAVIGTGYVGLVVGACLSEAGNYVVCVDSDERKIRELQANRIPIYEPGLEALVVRNQEDGRLRFDTEPAGAVRDATVVIIAVGTPPGEDGSADLSHVLHVASKLGEYVQDGAVVVTKSTVPVGTAEQVRRAIAERTPVRFHVCSNPEFLKEGAAVDDFMKPERVIIGTDSHEATEILRELYAPFVRTGNPLILMDSTSAELTKYAANAMLATRISFMNQMAELCDRVGADVALVRQGIGSDPRIGQHFLFPGPGFGGSCFPKDVRALVNTGDQSGLSLDILKAVQDVNQRQKHWLFERICEVFGNSLGSTTVAVWGLAFKARTDDIRESPSIDLIDALLAAGAQVQAHDPKANESAQRVYGDQIRYYGKAYEALEGADALAIVTEWMEFRNPDFDKLQTLMNRPLIFDARNLYDPRKMRDHGIEYVGIGRATRR